MLRGVENRRNIFFMYITRCVPFARIIPRRRIRLGGRMVCSVAHEAKGGREKKDDDKKWNCKSTPFHYLPISASLELLE